MRNQGSGRRGLIEPNWWSVALETRFDLVLKEFSSECLKKFLFESRGSPP